MVSPPDDRRAAGVPDLAVRFEGLAQEEAARRVGEILKDYAVKLPIAPLEAPKK